MNRYIRYLKDSLLSLANFLDLTRMISQCGLGIDRSGKSLGWELSVGELSFGEMSVGELSVGEMSVGEMSGYPLFPIMLVAPLPHFTFA